MLGVYQRPHTYPQLQPPVAVPAPATLLANAAAVFPDNDILGLKLVNQRPTRAVVTVSNNEDVPVTLGFISGVLQKLDADHAAPAYKGILRNLTAARYDAVLEPGESRDLPYTFVQDMTPRDVRLLLVAVMESENGDIFQVNAYNGTAAIVEHPTSFFDPQM